MHSTTRRRRLEKAGIVTSRETRPQFHDGHAIDEKGKNTPQQKAPSD